MRKKGGLRREIKWGKERETNIKLNHGLDEEGGRVKGWLCSWIIGWQTNNLLSIKYRNSTPCLFILNLK